MHLVGQPVTLYEPRTKALKDGGGGLAKGAVVLLAARQGHLRHSLCLLAVGQLGDVVLQRQAAHGIGVRHEARAEVRDVQAGKLLLPLAEPSPPCVQHYVGRAGSDRVVPFLAFGALHRPAPGLEDTT